MVVGQACSLHSLKGPKPRIGFCFYVVVRAKGCSRYNWLWSRLTGMYIGGTGQCLGDTVGDLETQRLMSLELAVFPNRMLGWIIFLDVLLSIFASYEDFVRACVLICFLRRFRELCRPNASPGTGSYPALNPAHISCLHTHIPASRHDSVQSSQGPTRLRDWALTGPNWWRRVLWGPYNQLSPRGPCVRYGVYPLGT